MPKIVKIICIKPNGDIKLKDVELKKTSYGLDAQQGNASQSPEFIRKIDDIKYCYVLSYNIDDLSKIKLNDKDKVTNNEINKNQKPINIYSDIFLDYKSDYDFRGKFYLEKHQPSFQLNYEFDFTKEITYEEFEKYDTTVSCDDNDIVFINNEINQRIERLTFILLLAGTIYAVKHY